MIYLHYLLGTAPKREGGIKDKPKNLTYCGEGLPEPAPRWPQERDYRKVRRLITYEKGLNTDYINSLEKDSCLIEVGFGDGKFLNDVKNSRKDIKTVGVTVTSWEISEAVDNIDEIYVQYVPNDKTLLENMEGAADAIVDCFASLTFAENPVHALIYLTLLLKNRGQITGVTYLETENGYSTFGSPETRLKITEFFKEHLNSELVFNVEKFALTCATHYALQIQLVRGEPPEKSDFEDLKKLSDENIGVPENIKVHKSIAMYNFGSFAICKKEYKTASK